jgi:hypothetical protein
VTLNRRLAALEARVPPALAEVPEGAREELALRLDVLRGRLLANRDLHEDGDGALCLPDGTRLADLGELRTVGDVLQDHRARRLGAAMVRCAADGA